ncbi:hypothetical protein KORDIASMS9_00699 [Kordia sp. SMS9]|uniref:hypothetical protein n=1 Tax=Kordia sp. SMS9 TaxID=2282170 RepID=UPI000E0DBA2D|nr:hypothetical protein [Kordia sp. SMS9]AXG68484.1 hypothetical protein KORDIASMS9_00699 [Kordia sp. SMS9]
MNWKNQGNPGLWTLNTIAKNGTDIYCVNNNNSIGLWSNDQMGWIDKSYTYGNDIKMIAFDKDGTMWCVKTDHKYYKWHPDKWSNLTNWNGHNFKMVAFDLENKMWFVTLNGELFYNDHSHNDSPIFKKQEGINWTLNWVDFSANDPSSEIYCVGAGENLGKFETDNASNGINQMNNNWKLKMIYYPKLKENNANVLCVGAGGNLGFFQL